MLDRKRNLNKLIRILKLAEARKARRMQPSQMTKQADHRTSTQVPAHRLEGPLRSPLTDTEALARKVRADMVRDAQAAFAAVMAELNASQINDALHESDDFELTSEESGEAITGQHLIQADRVGEA